MFELHENSVHENLKILKENGRVEFIFEKGFNEQVILKKVPNFRKKIEIKNGANVELIEFITDDVNESISNYELEVYGTLIHHQVLLSKIEKNNLEIKCNVYDDASYTSTLIDLNKGNSTIKYESNILGEGGNSSIYTAAISGEKQNKYIKIHTINFVPHTENYMSNFGIGYDEGKLEIEGIGDIRKGAYGSSNKQNSTMIVFDEKAKAINKPYLFIDEDDVQANHASAVGKIDEQTIFYLCSRGLTLKQAKKYISLGHFKPVLNMIKNDEIKERVLNYLEEVIKDD